ncbi:hypothetical protein PRIC2_014400 [Phytophthora ramorum]
MHLSSYALLATAVALLGSSSSVAATMSKNSFSSPVLPANSVGDSVDSGNLKRSLREEATIYDDTAEDDENASALKEERGLFPFSLDLKTVSEQNLTRYLNTEKKQTESVQLSAQEKY